MIIDIPKLNNFSQSNDGELGGTLSRTFNVDFEEFKGKVTLSRRMNVNTTVSDEAGLTVPSSFTFWEDRYYAIAGGTIYKSDTVTKGDPSIEMSVDDATDTPSGLSSDDDLILFNGKPYIISTAVYSKSGTTWTSVATDPAGGYHSSCVYANRLYVSDLSDNIISMNTSDTFAALGTTNTFNLNNSKMKISSIRPDATGIWIATVNQEGGRGEMIKWDGENINTADNSYEIPDVGVKALIVHESVPTIVTSRGLIMRFNGSFFQEVARFPFYYEIKALFQREDRDGWITDNSIAIIDNKIHMLIGNRELDTAGINDNNRSYGGIWVLDSDYGLVHKYAFYGSAATSTDVNTAVDVYTPGALFPAGIDVNLNDFEDVGKFICGAEYYSDATTRTFGVFSVQSKYEEGNASSFATYPSLGWLVTSQIQAEQIEENWKHAHLIFKKFVNTDDQFVIKARSNEDAYADSTITWTSTTTFTSTGSEWSIIKTDFDNAVDHEVTILRGKGGGMCSHITAISEAGGTYTVTVDETHTGATSGTAKARIEKWSKIESITDTAKLLTTKKFSTGQNSTWIQFKVFFLGKGANPVMERLVSASSPHTLY